MYVREYMNRNVITIDSETLLPDAEKLMLEKKVGRLPVLEGGKLAGLLTRGRIRETVGHHATSLASGDLYNRLESMKVKELMETDLCTVTPYTPVEWAVTKAQTWNIGTLLVVNEEDYSDLVGILTTTDLYKLLSEVLGFGEEGARLHIFDPARAGGCQEVLSSIIERGIGIKNMYHVRPPALDMEDCIIHLDVENAGGIVDKLREKGYEVEIRQC